MNEAPNYYAIIPASVRYDNRIPANAKLLYGEITALCNKEGYCWAGNAYFAKLYEKNERSIINWINALKEAGYIEVSFVYVAGRKEIEKRIIRLAEATPEEDQEETPEGGEKNFTTPRKNNHEVVKIISEGDEKKCGDNITNNTKKNTTTTHPVRKDSEPAEGSQLPPRKQEEAVVVGAKNNFYSQEELKAAFAKIDGELVFDRDFYIKAGTYLTQSGLDDQYLSWLYKQCLLKKPRSLNGLFYKLFFADNMAELFKVQSQPPPPPEPAPVKMIVCPVCGAEHSNQDEECARCGLRKHEWGNTREIKKLKKIFLLPPARKAAFQQEHDALFENGFKDIPGILKRQREIYEKYGIT